MNELSPRQRVAVLNAAIQATATVHSRVYDQPFYAVTHMKDAGRCTCEYGMTIRGLKLMRREYYVAIEHAKKKVVKK
jgi:hypothetical protein